MIIDSKRCRMISGKTAASAVLDAEFLDIWIYRKNKTAGV